jgi:hypothetical protein
VDDNSTQFVDFLPFLVGDFLVSRLDTIGIILLGEIFEDEGIGILYCESEGLLV